MAKKNKKNDFPIIPFIGFGGTMLFLLNELSNQKEDTNQELTTGFSGGGATSANGFSSNGTSSISGLNNVLQSNALVGQTMVDQFESTGTSGSKKTQRIVTSVDNQSAFNEVARSSGGSSSNLVVFTDSSGSTVGGLDFSSSRSVTSKEASRLISQIDSTGSLSGTSSGSSSSKKSSKTSSSTSSAQNFTPVTKKEEKSSAASSFIGGLF